MRRSAATLFVLQGAGTVVRFVGIAYFARKLGAGLLGAYFLFRALYWFLRVPADLGISDAVQKRISEGQSAPAVFATGALLKALPLLVVAIAIGALRGVVNAYVGVDAALLLLLLLFIEEYGRLTVYVLRGEFRISETATIEMCRHVVWAGVGTVLVGAGFEVIGLIYASIAGAVAVLLLGVWKLDRSLGTPSLEHARRLLAYSKYRSVTTVGVNFYSWMDVAIVGVFLTHDHVGAYEVSWQITTVVLLLSHAVAATIFPHISSWSASGNREKLERLIPRTLTPTLLFAIPAFLGTLLLSNPLLEIVFGAEYGLASTALIVLMGEKLFRAVHVIFGRALEGLDKPDLSARSTVLSLSLNGVLNVLLIWRFGLVGAAVATTLASAVDTVVHARYLSRFVDIVVPYEEIGWCVLAATGMATVVAAVRSVVVVDSPSSLAFVIGIGVAVYGSLLLAFDPFRTQLVGTIGDIVS